MSSTSAEHPAGAPRCDAACAGPAARGRARKSHERPPEHADAADFLRVICVGCIGWYHIWQQSWLDPNLRIGQITLRFYPLVAGGYMFVDLMLALSGFLLMLGWLNGSRDTRTFFTHRAARILPSYLLCLLVMLFGFALPQGLYDSAGQLWGDILAHLSFTHNLFPSTYLNTRLNGALWTLAVEVQFYLLFPLLARAFARRPLITYGCMVGLSWLVRGLIAALCEDSTLYVNRLSAMLDVYANGMLAALIFHRLGGLPYRRWRAWLSTALALLSAFLIYKLLDAQAARQGYENIHRGQLMWRWPLSALGCAFLVCGSRALTCLRALMSNPLTRFLSGISFNFYIWHQFLAVKLKEWRVVPSFGPTPNLDYEQPWQSRYTLLCFIAALAVAVLLTYCVEKPCARWIRSHPGSRKPLERRRGK